MPIEQQSVWKTNHFQIATWTECDWLDRFDAQEKEKEDAEVELAQRSHAFRDLRRERRAELEDVFARWRRLI